MVLRHAGGGGSGGFLAGKQQVVPVNYEAEVSQRLLEASLRNDLSSAHQCLADPFVDVNYIGAVCLKIRKTGVHLREESPIQLRVSYEEFRTDATPLFVAVTNGNAALVTKLLVNSASLFTITCLFYWNLPQLGVGVGVGVVRFCSIQILNLILLPLLLIIFVLLVVFSIGYLIFLKSNFRTVIIFFYLSNCRF